MIDAQAWVDALRRHDWRQGSVLPQAIVEAAKESARWPPKISIGPDDWLIVLNHPCDLRNPKPDNEPVAEVLVARPHAEEKANPLETHGRNSRRFQFEGEVEGTPIRIVALAHERFPIDRFLLSQSPPDQRRVVPPHTLQILITWITKRYKRQAFPDEFDRLARKARDKVDKFLTRHADQIAVVFVHFADREGQTPRFELAFRVLIKKNALAMDWPTQKADLERKFEACWDGVKGVQVDALVVQDSHFSIGDMLDGDFKTFDRDWISYAVDPEEAPAPEF